MGDLPEWTTALPSELAGAAVLGGLSWSETGPWLPLTGLFAEGALLFAISNAVHRRLVESVESGPLTQVSPRCRRPDGATAGHVAGHLRGGRCPAANRAALGARPSRDSAPGPIVATLAVAFGNVRAPGALEPVIASKGYMAFGAGLVFALYAAQAFTMNQFGSDRSGLTREFIAPIRDVDLVRGKAVGCAIIIGAGAVLSLLCALLASPGGSPALWLATALGGVAAFVLTTPATAMLSIWLPVASDLSKTGTAGNPHGLAMVLGTIVVAARWLRPPRFWRSWRR